ncbi:multiple epidermal growth factor-like domains protein 10 isoform X2 [Saccostrea cucullata]|uniref:multiple epidermal growth factor-like domains protein 10 isoform X2 n=1 Tax=Saccostrea cuccullata TaxID=36930 RepID=UPI002ED265D9
MNVTINRVTRGIALFNSRDPMLNTSCEGFEPSFASIEICEVKVMGCGFQQYGENCTSCPLKCMNQECDAFDGSCKYGCSNKLLKSPDCMVCVNEFYGLNCTEKCGHCKSGTYCNKLTGICEEGCEDHWEGSTCNVCKNGFYGDNCTKTCGHCKPGTYCHKVTGICQEGCDDHWNGSQCNECRAGFFGRGCERPCGSCRNGTFCDTITGKCPEGCEGDWIGIICYVLSSSRDTKTGEETSNTSSVVISVLATLLVVIVTYLGFKFVKNKWKKWKSGTNVSDTISTKFVENPQLYDRYTGDPCISKNQFFHYRL